MPEAAAPAAPAAGATPPAAPPTTPAPAPAPAPDAKPAEKPEERREQLLQIGDKLKSVFKDRLRGKDASLKPEDLKEKPPEKKPEAKTEPKVEAKEPEAKPETKPEPEVKPEAKPTRVGPRRKPEAEAATEAARAAAEAAKAATELVKSQNKKPTAQEKQKQTYEDLIVNVPESYKQDLPILESMEKFWPERYKNLAHRYASAAIRTEEYQRKWQGENPDKDFNPQDPEHDRFFGSNEVEWDERDFQRALARMETEPLLEQERARTKKLEEELRAKEAAREAEPAIRKRLGEEAKTMVEAISKDLVSMVDEQGNIIESELSKLDEKHPLAAEITARATRDLTKFVNQVERIFHPSGQFPFEDKNPEHVALAEYVLAKEQQILGLSEEQQLASDGRRFTTRAKYFAMDPAERQHYWQLEAPEITLLRRLEITEMAKQAIEGGRKRLETVAGRLGFVKAEVPKVAQNGTEQTETPAPPAQEKPNSPSAPPAPKTDTMNTPATQETKNWRAVLKAQLRGHTVGR